MYGFVSLPAYIVYRDVREGSLIAYSELSRFPAYQYRRLWCLSCTVSAPLGCFDIRGR